MTSKKIEHLSINPGIEITFTQVQWQNIYFDELNIELDSKSLPSQKFYNNFYENLFSKYDNYDSLPKNWLTAKKDTAINISKEILDNQKILSFGCGIGYIEKILTELNPTIELFAYDFSDNASKWIKDNSTNINYINNLEINEQFDLIYLCQVLYSLSYSDCIELIKKLSTHLKPKGRILLINTSIFSFENGEIDYRSSLLKSIKNSVKTIIRKLLSNSINHKSQFWGWHRNNKKYFDIAIEADMNIYNFYSASKQSFIILSK